MTGKTFKVTPREEAAAKTMMEDHGDCKGGSPEYDFQTCSGYGYTLLAKCPSCGYIRNVTDTDSF